MKKLTAAIKAMADEPRLSILIVLALRGAVCVSHLQEAMRTPQPTVSRYLAILRNAGLLEAERKGQWVYYRLNEEEEGLALEIIKRYSLLLKDSSKIKKIMDRLDKIEQQPSLTADVEETEKKGQAKADRPRKRVKRNAVQEKAVEAEETQQKEEVRVIPVNVGINAVTVEVAGTSKAEGAPETGDVAVAQVAPAPSQEEAVKELEPTAEPSVREKKGKREKKPQPPSLFDF